MGQFIVAASFLLATFAAYGSGRSRESMWWLRTMREIGSDGADETNVDWRKGHLDFGVQMLGALERRERTWRGKWLA